MAEVLQSLSNDLADAVETAGRSVVRVVARRRQPASGIVWSADGVILTAHHVVERDENIKIGLPDGSTVAGTLVGRDPTTDIAVIRVPSSGLTPAAWVDAEGIRVGHLVVAAGRPEGTMQATLGIISSVDGGWRTGAGGAIDSYVQTDVVMYPGFSGGPLVSAAGPFLGLNSSALLRGVSVTIPAATLRRVVETLVTHGRVKRGFLGISAQPVRLPQNASESSGQETGLLLISVEPGSPAEQGGLLLGDTLIGLDGESVRQMDDLMALLSGDRVGRTVTARVLRGGQLQDAQVKVGERD
jgi:S1-C subfamily serine protease